MRGSGPRQRTDPGPLAVGTAPLGGLYSPVATGTAIEALTAAAQTGVTHFDTAPHYGRGLAEERLGAFLAATDDPERFTVSTKVGRSVQATTTRAADDIFVGAPPGESVFDFSPGAIRDQLDQSRRRLGRDRIDLVLIHDPDDHLDAALGAAAELIGLRDTGAIGAVGLGTNTAPVAEFFLDRVELDAILLAGRITLLEDSGEAVAARCARDGVSLLAAGVLQSGILAGSDTYDYLPAPAAIRTRVGRLEGVCAEFDVPLHTAAIAHPRRVTGVTTVLVGIRSPDEARSAAVDVATSFPAGFWDAIDAVRAGWSNGHHGEGIDE